MDNLLNLKERQKSSSAPFTATDRSHKPRKESCNKRMRSFMFIKVLVGLAIVLAVVWWIFGAMRGPRTWQAVFLTNNQVYFGHFYYRPFISTTTLKDIYYLQITQPLQPQGDIQPQPEFKIIKLGSEIHGPKDKMVIPKSQILFWENLRDDSLVVKAILENKNK